jgi:hemolysin III
MGTWSRTADVSPFDVTMTTDPRDLVPLLRGVSHAYAFWAALAATVGLALLAPSATARIAALVYGVGLCALFAASATYHRWRWHPRWRPLLRRIDHSTIFVFIAASYTPVALLVMHGTLRWVILAGVWAGAAGGIVLSVAWITAPRALSALCYLGLGWFSVVAMPQMIERLSIAPLILLAAGGVLYTAGAIVYATQRPNPWPRTFGFHEVFHALVIAAALVQFVAMAGWVIPAAE